MIIDLNKIKKLLEKKTGYYLSKKLGVSKPTITRWKEEPLNMTLKYTVALQKIVDEEEGENNETLS